MLAGVRNIGPAPWCFSHNELSVHLRDDRRAGGDRRVAVSVAVPRHFANALRSGRGHSRPPTGNPFHAPPLAFPAFPRSVRVLALRSPCLRTHESNVQQVAAQLTWGHLVLLLDAVNGTTR
jgi:hypothetical protein